MASTIEKYVEVDAPLRAVYNQWTQFEEFPMFMDGIKSVTQISPNKTHWVADIGFKEKEWDADIVEQTPDTRIAWRNTTGAENAGIVSFQSLGADRTKVTARITYHPETFVEMVGDFLGVVSNRVQGDLDRFKEFIEQRGHETGGWRGEIHGGEVQSREMAGSSKR